MKRILAVGGGSGGHVTPVVAVLRELKEKHPKLEIRFWSDRNFAPQAHRIIDQFDSNVRFDTVWAGKFRRYHHLSKIQHMTIPSVIFPNIRDAFLVLIGIVQSIIRLILWRPDVVFTKGGYVCLPVGVAARLLRIPLVIHDSDAVPGLTNRLLAPLANRIATGMPLQYYNYPTAKSSYVGIPIDPAYKILSEEQQQQLKTKLGFEPERSLTVFAGGGLGARLINEAVARNLDDLLKFTNVVLLSGASQYDELRSLTPTDDPRFVLKDFVPGLPELFGAADVVVTRAGATALLELAALGSPTIVIPSKRLNWQVKHAEFFVVEQAVLSLDEDKFDMPGDRSLIDAVRLVLGDAELRHRLSNKLHRLSKPRAAIDMAALIERAARKRR